MADPENKLFDIGTMKYHKSLEVLLAEVEKCVVLCANCHRIIEYEKRQSE